MDAVLTVVGVPLLGALLLVGGWWGRRHADLLVGSQGAPDLRAHRRAGLMRGSLALAVAGVFMLVGGLGAAMVVVFRG
ncbi:hypothetical protein [Nocardioides sp.]|uniref:hypothetical protein n=1 Tax=Nocardioides sp. TaxID=35761 RepID=UPI00351928E2